MALFSRLQGAIRELTGGTVPTETRSVNENLSWLDPYGSGFLVNGMPFGLNQTMGGKQEEIQDSFVGYATQLYRANGIVFSVMRDRLALFSQARFQFRQMTNGRPGDLFGTSALDILDQPWPGGTTSDLLGRVIQSADLSGNAFILRHPNRLKVLRPDWVTIILGSFSDPDVQAGDLDAELLGYVYHPGGKYSNREPVPLLRESVAHFAPTPDPLATYRGMSWLTPIIPETKGDAAATVHKLKYFENGATPNLVVSLDPAIGIDAFEKWITAFGKGHDGIANAYKTIYLGAGAKAQAVGSDLQQMDFKVTQGAGETRIAAAGGIHPVIAGFSEGLSGSSLNVGNFGAARRLTGDKTMRWLWQNIAGSLQTIVPPPGRAQLWYDDRDISFLREDRKDAADIEFIKAQSIRQLVDAGYEPVTVVKAVEAEDMGLLKHSGLYSVQLQPPGTVAPTPAPGELAPVAKNGKEPLAALLNGAKP